MINFVRTFEINDLFFHPLTSKAGANRTFKVDDLTYEALTLKVSAARR